MYKYSTTAMQCMHDICYNYGLDNDVLFNPLKSVCMLFKPNRLWVSRPYRAPPPKTIKGGFIFFAKVSSATKIFSPKKKWIL